MELCPAHPTGTAPPAHTSPQPALSHVEALMLTGGTLLAMAKREDGKVNTPSPTIKPAPTTGPYATAEVKRGTKGTSVREFRERRGRVTQGDSRRGMKLELGGTEGQRESIDIGKLC